MPASKPPTRPTPPVRGRPNPGATPAGAKSVAGKSVASKSVASRSVGGATPSGRGTSGPAARGGRAGATAVPAKKQGRLAKMRGTMGQLGEVLKITYTTDKALPLWLIAAFLPLPLIGLVVGLLIGGTGSTIYYTVIGAFLGLLAALIVFGRRAEKAAYNRLGDSPGAAAAAMNTLKKNWTIEPGIGGTRTLEVVHRAVGRPGIVLVGEGPSDNRVKDLLAAEARRHARVAPDTPIHQIMAGSTAGRVPVRNLGKRIGKLRAVLSGSDVSELNRRLKALGLGAPKMPAGPPPKGVRMPKGLRPPPADTPTGGAKTR